MAARYVDAEKWRARHRSVGERYAWEKAMPVEDPRTVTDAEADGRLYVPQTVNEAWRILVHQTELDYEDKEFDLILKGTTACSVMPDETFLARLDRITLLDRKMISRGLVERGSGSTDTLVFKPVLSLVSVRQGTTVYVAGVNYQLTGNTVQWLTGGPSAGTKYSVEYLYSPRFIYIGSDRPPRPDRSGTMMPQRGAMLQYQPSS